MAKGKYEKWLKPDNLILLEAWARDGLTDEQIASNIGINVATLYRWKEKYCEICESLKKGKEIVDVIAENSLYSKALGFTKTIKKPIKVKEVLYKDGKRISDKEHIEYAEEEIYVPPDTTALIFWLKNRKPNVWRDRPTADNIKIMNKLDGLLQGLKDNADNINR